MLTDTERYQQMRARFIANCVHKTERSMALSRVDACLDPFLPTPPKRDANYWRGFTTCRPSDHSYNYSMGIGDAWSVQTLFRKEGAGTYEGLAYTFGLVPPRYPVPAIVNEVWHGKGRVVIVQPMTDECGPYWLESYRYPE